MIYDLDQVPPVTGGVGARAKVGAVTAALAGAGAPVLLVADPGLEASGLVSDVAGALGAAGLGVTVFCEFTGDPKVAQADAAAAIARARGARAVVALGGGSALDLGKAVAAVAPGTGSAGAHQMGEAPFPAGRLRTVAVPTTSGTGSEATRTAILTRDDGAKVWLWGQELKFDRIVLDPEATVGLPRALTAQTGIDALVHALEAATNANASPANNHFAHEAIRLSVKHLEAAVRHGGDVVAREGMQRAAMLAGVAIDNAGTAVAHTIGHALASLRPIHHGRSVALGLMATLAWNVEADDGRFAAAARAMGLASAADLAPAFDELVRAVGIKVSLADEFAGIAPVRLAQQMAAPENAAMRRSNFRPIGDDDLIAFATAVLTRT